LKDPPFINLHEGDLLMIRYPPYGENDNSFTIRRLSDNSIRAERSPVSSSGEQAPVAVKWLLDGSNRVFV
jgi:hypothetical protein